MSLYFNKVYKAEKHLIFLTNRYIIVVIKFRSENKEMVGMGYLFTLFISRAEIWGASDSVLPAPAALHHQHSPASPAQASLCCLSRISVNSIFPNVRKRSLCCSRTVTAPPHYFQLVVACLAAGLGWAGLAAHANIHLLGLGHIWTVPPREVTLGPW